MKDTKRAARRTALAHRRERLVRLFAKRSKGLYLPDDVELRRKIVVKQVHCEPTSRRRSAWLGNYAKQQRLAREPITVD